jgi:hypothetical protein
MVEICEHGDETLCSIKGGEFFDKLSDCQFQRVDGPRINQMLFLIGENKNKNVETYSISNVIGLSKLIESSRSVSNKNKKTNFNILIMCRSGNAVFANNM